LKEKSDKEVFDELVGMIKLMLGRGRSRNRGTSNQNHWIRFNQR